MPPCSFETFTDKKYQYTSKIKNEADSFVHFWMALRLWINELDGIENFLVFESVN
jgi:hypothetical protein